MKQNQDNISLNLYEAQASLFERIPQRRKLLDLSKKPEFGAEIAINVWRNHGFESMIPIAESFFSYCQMNVSFNIGAYDDSLSFFDLRPADVEIIWLDSRRILSKTSQPEFVLWLKQRILALRKKSSAPILLLSWGESQGFKKDIDSVVEEVPAAYVGDLLSVCEEYGVPLIDERTAKLAGTSIGGKAQIVIVRKLVCHWLSALLLPPIKALALDLDNTLHAGVLGEDGVSGVILTPQHSLLQQALKEHQQNGVFLTLVSKNEEADARVLFRSRRDYPLNWCDFSAAEVSWDDKALGIQEIASKLRISSDAILFVDDNPGELLAVNAQLPELRSIFAHEDASLTQRAIKYFPGLWRWDVGEDDSKRIQDLHVNDEREVIANNANDLDEYFRALQVKILVHQDETSQANRLADLCGKTNQFNLAIRRYSKVELYEFFESDSINVASVEVSDRLSDSGVIAVIVAELKGECMYVNELCVSCRAMGRHLESAMIISALREMPIFEKCKKLKFAVQVGDRNQPALKWISNLACQVGSSYESYCEVDISAIEQYQPPKYVSIKVRS